MINIDFTWTYDYLIEWRERGGRGRAREIEGGSLNTKISVV